MSIDAARRWRDGTVCRELEAAFAALPDDDPIPAAEAAERLFADPGWIDLLLAPWIAELAREPFFEPPFKVSRDPRRIGAILFETARVSILGAVQAPGGDPPATIVMPGRMAVTCWLRSGGATLRRWRAGPVTPDFTAASAPPCAPLDTVELADGMVLRLDGRTDASFATGATSAMVTLTATIRAGAAPLIREYRMADGALVRVGSGDEAASRVEMLLTYLRASARADAKDCFEAATHDPAFQLRWAAMREWLALDARAALPRLRTMAAGDPHDEVRASAAATLVTLRTRLSCRF